MTQTTLDMIQSIAGEIEAAAGSEVRSQVTANLAGLNPKSSPEETALWVQAAMYQLDSHVKEETRSKVMSACGANCARINHAIIDRARARWFKAKSEEAFLTAEIKKLNASSRLERDGDALYQVYTPAGLTRPMRCFCALLRGLPDDRTVSKTYCQCSRGFVQTYWQEVLDRPVTVEVLETAVSGSSECRFKISLA